MTDETRAVCEGAKTAGVDEIVVNDGHGFGRTIDVQELPEYVKLIRGWRNDPMATAQLEGLDDTFDAVLFVGAHARGGSTGNPMAHTMSSMYLTVSINGTPVSEPLFSMHAAATVGVPVVFVSGDRDVCEEARKYNPGISVVPVKQGIGDSTVSIHPATAARQIREGAKRALKGDTSRCRIKPPPHYTVVYHYRDHRWALKASHFPGARIEGSDKVVFEADDFTDVLRMKLFV
jgi:D-amino peptidase